MTQTLEPLPFTPVYKRVVVEPLKPEETTLGGIIIPEVAQQRANRGLLLGAGLGALDILASHGINLGDVVLFGKYAGVWEEWRQPGATSSRDVRKLLVIQADDILGSEGLAKRQTAVGQDAAGIHILATDSADRRFDPRAT